MSGACGCCAGVEDRTPLQAYNRPGLSAIAYRVGTHPDFLASMVAGLTDAARTELAALTTRDTDDFSVGLLDAWAVVADVLAFYTERLAQEAYLRTARERISLQELGRLIGYRLRPGLAAETHLAFALEPPPPAPAAASKDPGSAPPVTPEVVHLAAGLRVQSIPGPGEQPQTFETVEDVDARPEWNALAASTSVPFVPGAGATSCWLKGTALNLKKGDAFLLAGADVIGDRWDLRVLTAVAPDPGNDRTEVTWAGGLGSLNPAKAPADDPVPYVLRKRLNVFGYNAPMWESMTWSFRFGYPPEGANKPKWPGFVLSPAGGAAVDLDGSHPDVVAGSWVVLSTPATRELWQVAGVSELSRAEFAVSGKVTRASLVGGENFADFVDDVRNTTVLAVSEALVLADAPDDSAVQGKEIRVDVDVTALPPGRSLVVRGATTAGPEHAETVELVRVDQVPGGWSLVLKDDLSTSYRRDTVVVHGNVARASHGETVQQLLGSGSASAAFQRFTLAHAPLTYLQSTDPSGAEAALEVRVNDVRWDEVPTLYPTGPYERAYAVRTDEDGATYVQFGDGARGARPPSGSNNIRARYRTGLGAAGNVRAGALAQLLDRPLGAKGVSNPAAAAGGVDPEAETSARAAIPLAVRTLGRAVSLLDYQDFSLAFAGVAKANAAVLALPAGRTIVVTVALEGSSGADDTARLAALATALHDHGDPHVQVVVLPHVEETFRLALKVAVDPAYEAGAVLAGVEAAVRLAWSFPARDFGQPVHRSEVVAVVHSVAGVVAVDVDRLYTGAVPDLADRVLASATAIGPGGTALAAGLLLLDPAAPDWLEVM